MRANLEQSCLTSQHGIFLPGFHENPDVGCLYTVQHDARRLVLPFTRQDANGYIGELRVLISIRIRYGTLLVHGEMSFLADDYHTI